MRHELIFHEAAQGTDQWLQDRIGMLTGSEAGCITTGGGIKFCTGALTLARKLVAERLTGHSQSLTLKQAYKDITIDGQTYEEGEFFYSNFENGSTKWGHVHEERSRELILEEYGIDFQPFNFVSIKNKKVGCSPDGFEESNGVRRVLELKHPDTKLVIGYLDDPSLMWQEHKAQCIHNAFVMNADEVWLAARDPRLPDPLNNVFALHTVKGDELKKHIEEYANIERKFSYMVKKLEEKINNIGLKILGLH